MSSESRIWEQGEERERERARAKTMMRMRIRMRMRMTRSEILVRCVGDRRDEKFSNAEVRGKSSIGNEDDGHKGEELVCDEPVEITI